MGPAMQINRLNLIFPPTTPGAPGASAQPDALKPEAGSARSAGLAAPPARKAVAAVEPSNTPETAAPAGVTLELGSAQKAAASGVYTRSGVVAGRASAAVDQTPAEQFVASAVNTLRDFDANKLGMGVASTSGGSAEALPASRFGGFKQAVAKLNVFA